MTGTGTTARQRGFALVIVLWAMVALTVGAALLAATGRRSLTEAEATGQAARATAAIDAAAQQAIFHLLAAGPLRWPASGARTLRVGDFTVGVAIADQAGAINPNKAAPALLAGLLVALGRPPAEAATLVGNIAEWREEAVPGFQPYDPALRYAAAGLRYAPPGAPFQSLGELGLVLGMTPALLARIRPYLSLWSGPEPDRALALPPVLAALRSLPDAAVVLPVGGNDIRTVALTCRIVAGPGRAARRLVVQLRPSAPRPFAIVESTPLEDG